MTVDDTDPIDRSSRSWDWHWYVLLGYPVASVLAIVSLGRLTAGGSVLSSGLGSAALVILITALGIVSLPALWRDAEFVRREASEWRPDRETYVGAAVLVPLSLAVLGGLAAGFGIALAIAVVAFLGATIAVCAAYLYNRQRTIGLLHR